MIVTAMTMLTLLLGNLTLFEWSETVMTLISFVTMECNWTVFRQVRSNMDLLNLPKPHHCHLKWVDTSICVQLLPVLNFGVQWWIPHTHSFGFPIHMWFAFNTHGTSWFHQVRILCVCFSIIDGYAVSQKSDTGNDNLWHHLVPCNQVSCDATSCALCLSDCNCILCRSVQQTNLENVRDRLC